MADSEPSDCLVPSPFDRQTFVGPPFRPLLYCAAFWSNRCGLRSLSVCLLILCPLSAILKEWSTMLQISVQLIRCYTIAPSDAWVTIKCSSSLSYLELVSKRLTTNHCHNALEFQCTNHLHAIYDITYQVQSVLFPSKLLS